jgi:hypothetical protein
MKLLNKSNEKQKQNTLQGASKFANSELVRCDQLKNKSSRRVTYGNPCYSIGSKANSIYFLNDRSVERCRRSLQ